MSFGRRLAQSRKRAGLTQVQLAVALGVRYDHTMISHAEAGRSSLLFDGATEAARELGVSLDYLAGLTDDPTPSAKLAEVAAKVSELEDAGALADHTHGVDPSVAYLSDLAVAPGLAVSAEPVETAGARCVQAWDLDAAAGDGTLFDEETAVGCLSFRRQWLDRHGLDATRCAVIGVKGESMEPTLPDGCSILIDRNRRSRRVGRIYVGRTDDGLIVKRAGKSRAGHWQLVSDHPDKQDWPTRPWPADAEVIGEVKWAARTF